IHRENHKARFVDYFFFQAEDGIRDRNVTGVQTCALPIFRSLEIGRDRPDEQPESYDRNREELVGELGDVLGNVAVIANKYDISLDEVFEAHKEKLSARYSVR